ncbi:hypothetical protein Tco_0994767 [Tanacetum coccineum]
MVRKNIKALKDVIENESHLIPKIVNKNLGGNSGRGGFIARRGGGSLAKRLMESNDGLGGGGFIVVGGRTSNVSKRA